MLKPGDRFPVQIAVTVAPNIYFVPIAAPPELLEWVQSFGAGYRYLTDSRQSPKLPPGVYSAVLTFMGIVSDQYPFRLSNVRRLQVVDTSTDMVPPESELQAMQVPALPVELL